MTQPNMKLGTDATTAANGASTWSGSSVAQTAATFFTRGTATDLDVVVVFTGSASSAAAGAAGTIALTLQGSASTAFTSATTVAADKGTVAAGTATNIGSAHFAQLAYPYYRAILGPSATITGQATVVYVGSGLQDSLDDTTQ